MVIVAGACMHAGRAGIESVSRRSARNIGPCFAFTLVFAEGPTGRNVITQANGLGWWLEIVGGLKGSDQRSPKIMCMPQSLANVLVHLVFSTKNREPQISSEIRDELNAYVTGVLRNTGCRPIAIGGVEDHMHLLFAISRTITIAQITEKIKTSSAKWAKDNWPCD